ncbi:hypothetical protein BD414DRAFT_582145 [Trametes punicea]|nr:hypothetical protein BD414DRAFT_582145 [Trametes punicea]
MRAELPYVAFLAAVLVLVPLPWHWRARNVATLSMIAWLFVINVIYGVDAMIWHHKVQITAVVWCDITTKIIIGAGMALPAACMCISIHLAQVASVSRVRNTKADKRRRQIIELLLCFGIPCIWMALHYTVQGHRFDIIEDYGCRPNTYISIPAIFLIWVPPLIFATVTLVYAGIALMHFLRHRITFARHLENASSGLTTSRYLRLMAMAFVEIIITAVSSSLTLWFTTLGLRPWTNWADVHWNFSRIDVYVTAFQPPLVNNYYYAIWYIIPVSSVIFFAFFAFGQDAVKEYTACLVWVRDRVFKCGFRKTVRKSKQCDGPFVSLPSSSLVDSSATIHSLPSYQSAVGEDDVQVLSEKGFDNKERYVARPIDRTDIMPIPIHHISAFTADNDSSYSSSLPSTPSHTDTSHGHSYLEAAPCRPIPHDLV